MCQGPEVDKIWVPLRNSKEGMALRWTVSEKVVETEAGEAAAEGELNTKFNRKTVESSYPQRTPPIQSPKPENYCL